MSSLSYKPLRKSVQLTHITDEEIRWKIHNRTVASEYLRAISAERVRPPDTPGSWHIVPESRGKISHILFTVPAHYDQKNPHVNIDPLDKRHFKTLINHLSRHKRQYTVLCHAPQVKEIQEWFSEAGISQDQLSINISVFNYSIWAQDAYVALNDDEGNVILSESICFTRDHDMSVADDLASQTDIRSHQSHLYFQGGNILETMDHVLVGMDYIRENEGRPFLESRERVNEAFARLFGKPVLAVGREELILHRDRQYLGGGVFQPVFHIDMFITPTGVRTKSGKELLLVASPRLARKMLNEEETPNDFDVYFDEVAEQLQALYDVHRVPILPTQFKTRDAVFPRHYYLSYNNVLTENFNENGRQHRHVYLPTFSDSVKKYKEQEYLDAYYGEEQRYKTLDAAARQLWESFGFTVFQMDALEDLAMSWGSVHCMVKTLQRTS